MSDRDLEQMAQAAPQPAAETPAPTDAAPSSSGQPFTSAGAIPPVSTAQGQPAPTASDRAFSGVGGFFKHIGQEAEVIGAEAVGVAELGGFRYPVKAYEAQVDGGLYRGSRIEGEEQMAALKQQGIQGVVNLCMENNDDAAPAAKLGLAALHVPILDNSAPTVAQMNQFIAFARAHPPTYVHCEAGKGRTGTAVACYRIAVDGWTADQAIDEGRSFGLSLINQIAFIRQFAETIRGTAPSASPETTPGAPMASPAQTSQTE